MTHSEEVLLAKILEFKHQSIGNQGDDSPALNQSNLKNVCAKLDVELVDRLDHTCSILGISKREFIELSLNQFIDRFESLSAEYDMYAPHESQGGKTRV